MSTTIAPPAPPRNRKPKHKHKLGIAVDGYEVPQHKLNSIARLLLMGVYDDNNPLSLFRGMRYLIKAIWEFIMDFNKHQFKNNLEGSLLLRGMAELQFTKVVTHELDGYHSKRTIDGFPEPTGININMMPFIMSDKFEETKLPQNLSAYYDGMISKCYFSKEQHGKIYYLTIQESFVAEGRTQRRPGLHVECPGKVCLCDEDFEDEDDPNQIIPRQYYRLNDIGKGTQHRNSGYSKQHFIHSWGAGMSGRGLKVDGIFMANNIDGSCVLWNCRVIADKEGNEVIGHGMISL